MQTTIAVDLAKNMFEIAVSRHPGRITERRRLSRSRLPTFFLQQPAATVLMEACGSSHHWARLIQAQGHRVRLLPPHHVSRYRTGNKTDRADAKALLEAHRNEAIQAVPVKSVEQQASRIPSWPDAAGINDGPKIHTHRHLVHHRGCGWSPDTTSHTSTRAGVPGRAA